jgi:hypothetical protein
MNNASVGRIVGGAAVACLLAACAAFGGADIGGTLGGLGSGLSITLQNNGGDNLTLSSNGDFTFDTKVSSGDAYSVTILTQPVGQTCTVANATGTVDSNSDDVSSVSVSCGTTALLSGTIMGLNSNAAVTLTLTQGTTVTPLPVAGPTAGSGSTTTNFAFTGANANAAYAITVTGQPAGQSCSVTANGTGTIGTTPISSVTVTCS